MSAYALPGLFPPVEDASAAAAVDIATATCSMPLPEEISSFTSLGSSIDLALPREQKSVATAAPHTSSSPREEASSASTCSSSGNSSATASTSSTSGYREYQQQQIRNIGRIPSRKTKSPPPPQQQPYSYAQLPPLQSLDDEQEDDGQEINANNSNNSLLGIAIKTAKIDPVRWVQFLTGNGSQNQTFKGNSKKTLRRRGKDQRGGAASSSSHSPQNSPVTRKSMLQEPLFGVGTSPRNTRNSPENEAIEFELSITFQGRKYTAKRTMQCIIKLRDDLIREMRARKRWLANQIPLESGLSGSQDSLASLQTPSLRHSNAVVAAASYEDRAVEIPEIPPLSFGVDHRRHHHCDDRSSMVGGMGFVGRGFTMLHAMVTSYVPVMDRWLKNVMAIVPEDSECLLNFLWEPTSDIYIVDSILESTNKESSGSLYKSSNRISMGSIKELDFEDDA